MNASSRQKAKHNYCYHEEGDKHTNCTSNFAEYSSSEHPAAFLYWAKGSMLLLPHAVNRQNIGLGSDYLCSRTCSILMYYIIMIIRVRD